MGALNRPERLLAATFAALIAVGTALLAMPVCHAGESISLLDAFFTATSAVCVTGLIVRDTATEFTRTGQVVILVLIQLGGLGAMTFSSLAILLARQHLSFGTHTAVRDAFFVKPLRGPLRHALTRILLITLVFEALGVALLLLSYALEAPEAGGLFEAVFLSVSSFCNAGFSIYTDSVIPLRDAQISMITIMGLIVAGGLGYVVLLEAAERFACRLRGQFPPAVRWSLHTRVVVTTSFLLIAAGALVTTLTGLGPDHPGFPDLDGLFLSVTARTAGFNSVPTEVLPLATLMMLMPLMLIGGSPGSCAGGVKTTSLVVWLSRVHTRLRGREHVTLGGRRIPQDVVRRAALLLAVAMLWNGLGILLLVITEGAGEGLPLEDVMFEQISAFGTVGLSTGLTPHLSTLGKLWICASMFAGRVGPLTVALVVLGHVPRGRFTYPEERVMIG